MGIADARRRLRVRANADTPDQSANARARGAEGIGLCRTEHMFLGSERVAAVQQMIFAETHGGGAGGLRRAAAAAARRLRRDLPGDGRAAGHGAPARPAAARVPAGPDRRCRSRSRSGRSAARTWRRRKPILAKVRQLHETNPMLGLRGVRLGIVKPGLYAMQVRAIVEAACEVRAGGGDPKVEIMIPLVATAPELQQMRDGARARGRRGPRGARASSSAPRVGHDDRAAARGRDGRRDRARPPTSSRSARTT